MTELMIIAFSVQLCVLVDVHQGKSQHVLSCHCRVQIVLETLCCAERALCCGCRYR